MKKRIWLLIPVVLLVIYILGPAPDSPDLPTEITDVNLTPRQLEKDLKEREANIEGLKEDNEGRIIWFDEPYERTPYVFLYLHGWSASYMEGDPLHREMARRYGANLYLPRLFGHGVELGDDNFADLTATNLMNSASQALAEAHILGDSVVIIGTSTGGTLALYLASIDPLISGMVLYSPNVKIYDPTAVILDDPWGVQIAKIVTGSEYYDWDAGGDRTQYWTSHYQVKALGELEALMEETMVDKTFSHVTQPTFVGYYYKNDSLQDHTVSVEAIQDMFPKLESKHKRLVAFPEVGHHVLASSLTSKDLESVRKETIDFLDSEAGLVPVSADSAMASARQHD